MIDIVTPATFADGIDAVYDKSTLIAFGVVATGALTVVNPTARPASHVVSVRSYYGDYYFRVWISPKRMDIQSLQYGVAYPVGVWNAFDHAVTLENINASLPGVGVQEATPINFAAYRYRELHLAFDNTVPVEGFVSVDFDFSAFTTRMEISFSASDLFVIVPDEGLTETLKWRTAIFEAVDGTERRAMLRNNPRVTYGCSVTITDDQMRAQYFRDIWRYLSGNFALPLFHEATYLTDATASGSTAIFFDPALTDLRPGQNAILYSSWDDNFLQVRIAAIHNDGATLDAGVTVALTDRWQILPVATVRIPDGTGIAMDHVNGSLGLNCERVDIVTIPEPLPDVPHFDGIPVIPYMPFVRNSIDENFSQQMSVFDNNVLPAWTYTNQKAPKIEGGRTFVYGRDDAELSTFWAWFASYTRGALRPFYVSSGREDLIPIDGYDPGETKIIVRDSGFKSQSESGQFPNIQMVFDDGSILSFGVVGVITGPLSGQLTINLTAALPDDGREISRISLFHKVRIADDQMKINHLVNQVIVDIEIRTVKE